MSEVTPETKKVVRRVVLERFKRMNKKGRFGSISPIIFNPTMAQTKVGNDDDLDKIKNMLSNKT
jgi:hypothetical protein